MTTRTRTTARIAARFLRRVAVAGILLVGVTPLERIGQIRADSAQSAPSVLELADESSIELGGSRVIHLPAGETYASLQLVRLVPDSFRGWLWRGSSSWA